jgi:NADH dehydrogenase FAD-containing subunit
MPRHCSLMFARLRPRNDSLISMTTARSTMNPAAVGTVGGVKLSGMPAWLFWVLVQLFYLIGFRNRIVVMFDWVWAYISFERSARVFTRK